MQRSLNVLYSERVEVGSTEKLNFSFAFDGAERVALDVVNFVEVVEEIQGRTGKVGFHHKN